MNGDQVDSIDPSPSVGTYGTLGTCLMICQIGYLPALRPAFFSVTLHQPHFGSRSEEYESVPYLVGTY